MDLNFILIHASELGFNNNIKLLLSTAIDLFTMDSPQGVVDGL